MTGTHAHKTSMFHTNHSAILVTLSLVTKWEIKFSQEQNKKDIQPVNMQLICHEWKDQAINNIRGSGKQVKNYFVIRKGYRYKYAEICIKSLPQPNTHTAGGGALLFVLLSCVWILSCIRLFGHLWGTVALKQLMQVLL